MPDKLPGTRVIKRFRVAREGQTVDGRSLSQQQIIDMAETYDPVEYAARINCEHMRSWWGGLNTGDGALGDVISVDAEMATFKQNGQDIELLCLYATLSALPVLVNANKEGKKLYTSIEFFPKFADTDRAYLVGLAVTDTPASRGTEPLKFNRNKDALSTDPEQELTLMTIDTTETEADSTAPIQQTPTDTDKQNPDEDGFLAKLSTLFSKKTGLSRQEQEAILSGFTAINERLEQSDTESDALKVSLSAVQAELAELKLQLNNQPARNLTPIPPSTGAGAELTDF